MRIAVVDYHKGNLKSVERGLVAAGGNAFITDDAVAIAQADAIVLPGVGSFADAAFSLEALGQRQVLRERILEGVPFLGICLGMHLMFEEGTEGSFVTDDEVSSHNAKGLAVLPGVVAALPRFDALGNTFKVPHVGWNSLEAGGRAVALDCPLLTGVSKGEYFYFTHGYVAPESLYTVATTTHSAVFPSAVAYRNTAFGVQFHPEKSSDAGAVLLRNFINLAKGA